MSEQLRCSSCWMPLRAANHYHPYAACLIYRQCKDQEQVETYLKEVIEHGRRKEREIVKRREAKQASVKTEANA